MGLFYGEYNPRGEKKSQLCFCIPKRSSNNSPRKWPSLLAMTTEVTHLFLLFSEDQSEVCQPSISHSAHDPVSSRLSPIQMLGLRAFSGLSQACALWMGCWHPHWVAFPRESEWWLGQITKCLCGLPCSGSLALVFLWFILITITFLRNWQITSYLA